VWSASRPRYFLSSLLEHSFNSKITFVPPVAGRPFTYIHIISYAHFIKPAEKNAILHSRHILCSRSPHQRQLHLSPRRGISTWRGPTGHAQLQKAFAASPTAVWRRIFVVSMELLGNVPLLLIIVCRLRERKVNDNLRNRQWCSWLYRWYEVDMQCYDYRECSPCL
jgi:hypothetical protein